MPIPTWPPTLPQRPTTNFSGSGGALIVRTPMDKGVPKQRRRGKKPIVLNVTYEMTISQLNTFETFVNNTLLGVLRFTTVHPISGNSIEVRIVPQGEGDLYSYSYIQYNLYSVQFQLEIMP